MPLKIIPLDIGTFQALPKQACTYRMYREETYVAPCIMWYIEGSKNNVIVDLGPGDPQWVLGNHGYVLTRNEDQEPVNALRSIGLCPDDIKIAVVTHLHWDHSLGFGLFKNARFFIQRKELQYAIAPLPCHRSVFHEKHRGKPEFVDYLDRIEAIDGDYWIEDGVELILIPSHTPGFQGVLVHTEEGKYFIAGDSVGLFECWETKPHIPSGMFVNLEDYYESMDRIERIADFVLPGHDMRVLEKKSYP